MSKPCYGLAGSLSTDDPTSDAMQIAADAGPYEEEEFLFGEEDWLKEDLLSGCCPECYWWGHAIYWQGDEADLDRTKESLRGQHRNEHPDCDGELDFG